MARYSINARLDTEFPDGSVLQDNIARVVFEANDLEDAKAKLAVIYSAGGLVPILSVSFDQLPIDFGSPDENGAQSEGE